MKVRAKFRCIEKLSRTSTGAYGKPAPVDSEEVHLVPVQGEGNEEWSRYTPGGDLRMQVTNPEAVKQFVVGADYYIDISPVESP